MHENKGTHTHTPKKVHTPQENGLIHTKFGCIALLRVANSATRRKSKNSSASFRFMKSSSSCTENILFSFSLSPYSHASLSTWFRSTLLAVRSYIFRDTIVGMPEPRTIGVWLESVSLQGTWKEAHPLR